VKVVKAKIRVIKPIQDDTNIEVKTGLKKGDVVITGPYTTVSKELNRMIWYILNQKAKRKNK
jgi:HlyD family secretion protein